MDISHLLKEAAPSLCDFRSSDVFNLGILLFLTITGVEPFTRLICEESGKIIIDTDCPLYKLLLESKFDTYWTLIDPDSRLSANFKNLF